MKNLRLFSVVSLFFLFLVSVQPLWAQSNKGTQISYRVDFGPVYPIEGTSIQLKGELELNDTTSTLEKLNFKVPLVSFQGENAGYLGWLANGWSNPDMSFRSNSIIKKGDQWVAKGRLEFRRRTNPVEVYFYRKNVGNEIVLEGHFTLRPRDYFFVSPPIDLVPNSIVMKFTMVFDKPEELTGQDIGMVSENR